MKKHIWKNMLRQIGLDVRPVSAELEKRVKVISLQPTGATQRGNMLLAYIIDPFLLPENAPMPNSHTQYWESHQIAQTFLELGFAVDVIDYRNKVFTPRKNYDYFVSARNNFSRIARLLPAHCMKIVHQDTSHWLDNNTAALQRCLEVKKKRRVSMASLKFVHFNDAMENADCATVLGNQFTIGTFQYARKPLYRIPISCCDTYPWPEQKDFNACRNSFVWLGSRGFIHKGLDLALEAFAKMPDYHLYVCGPFEQEKEFVEAFQNELFRTPNIHALGWVDVSSRKFIDLTQKCLGIVYPSCAEGGGGCVIQCMHAGLIPLATAQASVDIYNDFGLIIKDLTPESIQTAVTQISNGNEAQLRNMSRRAWEFARQYHTRENFARTYRQTIEEIIAEREGNTQKKPAIATCAPVLQA